MRRIIESFLGLLYPRLCLHCSEGLSVRGPLFCTCCLEQLTLVEMKGRCRTCFHELHKGRCDKCIHRKVVIHHQAAACQAMGPANTLLREIHKGGKKCIAAAASLMAYQWLETKLLLPEVLVPLPTSLWKKQKAGFDVQLSLAQELGNIFSISVTPALKAKFDRTHFLTQGEFRHRFEGRRQKGENLCDQRVLLVALEHNDALFQQAGQELKLFFPAQIDALAFATAVD
jgi:predicted amidophosphoribosyltransferase